MTAVNGPLFLVGCPRSGTTLLQRLLDAHPRVAVAPETFFYRNLWRRRATFDSDWTAGGRRRLVSQLSETPEFAEMGFDRAALDDLSRGADSTLAMFTAVLKRFAADHGAALVGEKTPNHLLYMRTLEKLFPRCRFVHIVRDPRAVVESWRNVPFTNGSVDADAEVWRKYMEAARLRPPRDRSRLLTIRYEGLVDDPEKVLRRVCAFAGIDFDPAMLTHERRATATVNAEREPWKAAALAPISRDSVDRWRRELSQEAILTAESVMLFEMLRLRFTPVSRPIWLWPRASALAAGRSYRQWRKRRSKR